MSIRPGQSSTYRAYNGYMPTSIRHLAVAAALILLAILWRFVNTETFHLYRYIP